MPAVKHHRLSFVCVNDVYSFDNVDDNSDHPRGGWCRAASKIKQLVRNKNENDSTDNNTSTTILSVVNGDVLGGSSLLVNCKGQVAIDVMNSINIDLAVLGNHEFDYGDEVLKQRLYESNFDWLGSNVYYPLQKRDDGDGSHNVKLQEKVLDEEEDTYYFPNICGNGKLYNLSNNIKVGIFGLVTKQTPKISCPSKDVTFDSDIIKVARRTAIRLRKQGAQVLVAITHLSEVEDRLLASDTVVGVDLVLGGHEHEPLATMIHRNQQHEGEDTGSSVDVREVEAVKKHNEGGVLIFKCGMNAYWVGSVDLDITIASSEEDDAKVTSISTSWSMEAVNSTVPEDPTTSDIVKRYRKETDENAIKIAFGEEIASTISLDDVIAAIGGDNMPLDTRMSSVRRREATGGNLVADAMHWVLQTSMSDTNKNKYPMLAMINGGFIRGDRLYKSGSTFTVRDVLNELPFARTMKVLEIEGYHLKSAMAQQFMGSSRGPTGAYPHLSSNARLTYSLITELDGSEDINIESFTVDNVQVLDAQKYLIAVTCFVAGGNEGCTSWLQSNCVQNSAWDDVNMSCILLKYLQSNSVIHPVLEDRVKKIN